MTACAFCGRENDGESRFCIDCGKPLNPSAARVVPSYNPSSAPAPVGVAAGGGGGSVAAARSAIPPTRANAAYTGPSTVTCSRCARQVDASLPFCGHCGTRLAPGSAASTCKSCGAGYDAGDLFCARCGSRVGSRVSIEASAIPAPASSGTLVFGARPHSLGPRLALLDEQGDVATVFTLERGEAVIGRGDADIRFADDGYMSPLHARLELRDGTLWLRDLGSRNASWVFVDEPTRLFDNDMVLVGSQVIRFRRLGFPGPYAPEADATRRMGSLTPSADVAVLEQLRADGSVRDTLHLSPGRSVVLGREAGDWLFPYDQTMSGRHAEVRSEDSEFFVHDLGSRNGVAVAVRGEKPLKVGQRLLVGDQILRVESM